MAVGKDHDATEAKKDLLQMKRNISNQSGETIVISNIEEMEHLMEILERLKMIEQLFEAFSKSEESDPARQEAYAEVSRNIASSFSDYFGGVEFCELPQPPETPSYN